MNIRSPVSTRLLIHEACNLPYQPAQSKFVHVSYHKLSDYTILFVSINIAGYLNVWGVNFDLSNDFPF